MNCIILLQDIDPLIYLIACGMILTSLILASTNTLFSMQKPRKNKILFTTCVNIALINAQSIATLAIRVKIFVNFCILTKTLSNLLGSIYNYR